MARKQQELFQLGSNIDCLVAEKATSITIPAGHVALVMPEDDLLNQTKGSTKPGKTPRGMYATTTRYVGVPGTNKSMICHLTGPMPVQQMRKARALKELDEDEASEPSVPDALASLRSTGLSKEDLVALLLGDD